MIRVINHMSVCESYLDFVMPPNTNSVEAGRNFTRPSTKKNNNF